MPNEMTGDHELMYKLVELGADKLASMLSELEAGNDDAAHYDKGGFQALKEAAFSLFGIGSAEFRSQCMFESTCRRLGGQTGGPST